MPVHKSAKGSEVKGHYNSLITSVLERKELSFPPPSLWGTLGIYLGQNPLRKVVTTYVLPVIRARDGFSPVINIPYPLFTVLHSHTDAHKQLPFISRLRRRGEKP